MQKQKIDAELEFLKTLKALTIQKTLDSSAKKTELPKEFNQLKAKEILTRMFDAEMEYLVLNPDDYFEIYD